METAIAQQPADLNFDYSLLLQLTRKLSNLVNLESELLSQMKVKDIKEIQAQKNDVAGVLEKQQRMLRDNPAFRASLTVEQKAELKAAAVEFDNSILKYQEHLFKAQKVNQLILNKMVETMREHVEKNRSYNSRGLKIAGGTELARNTPAIKYNTTA